MGSDEGDEMKLIAPTFIVLGTNVIAIMIVTTTVVAPYAAYVASISNQSSRSQSLSTSTTSTTSIATSTTSSSNPRTQTTTSTTSIATSTTSSSTTSTNATSGCEVTWSLPRGTIQVGDAVSGTVSAKCEGSAKWQIVNAQGSSVASGTSSCNRCSSVTLFSFTAGTSPLVPGSYTVKGSFDKGHGVVSSPTSSFTIGSGQQSSGAFLTMSASIVALAFLVKGRSRSTP
jgi:hypothetical protein